MKYILFLFTLSSCSIVMASKRDGVEFDSIHNLHTRSELIALGGKIISTERSEHGELVETVRFLNQRGSIARALMHGLLDITTVFFWELAGTPIESTLSQEKYISIRVTFDRDDQIQKMELIPGMN